MMRLPWQMPMAVWAVRDLMRHGALHLLLFSALASLVALMAIVLLLHQTLITATERLLAQAPAMVVRRVNAGGWTPLPAATATAQADAVAGVLNPRARIWGVVQGPQGPITLIGAAVNTKTRLPDGMRYPRPGECLVGPGVMRARGPDQISLRGAAIRSLTVAGRLPEDSSMAVYDVVVAHRDDAREVLGLAAGQASDLALDVFHADEADALKPILASAFDFPVQISLRETQLKRHHNFIALRGGTACLAFIPALPAMAALVVATGLLGRRRREFALLKALGWTGGDLLRLNLYKGAIVGAPAIATGMALAYGLMFTPGITWAARLLFGWHQAPPALYLSALAAGPPLALSALLAGLPYSAAVFWAGLRTLSLDAAHVVEENRE